MAIDERAARGSTAPAADWDGLIARASDGHLLQTYGWGELKARHGWTVQRFRVDGPGGFAAAQVLWRQSPVGQMGYIPRGPAVTGEDERQALESLFDGIHRAARRRNAVFLKVEPNSDSAGPLPDLGFRKSDQKVQPSVTLAIDLRQDLDAIMKRQHSKTRYNINLAARKGVSVSDAGRDGVEVFSLLMNETGDRDGFAPRPTAYYRDALDLLGDHAQLLLAEHEGEVLAGLFLTKFNGTATYLFGSSTSHKRNLMAPYLLQWEAMRRSKEAGMHTYDFWGVPEDLREDAAALRDTDASADDLPPWREHEVGDLWGVYRFKRGFGGRLATTCGAWDYIYSPARYLLWQQAAPRGVALLRANPVVRRALTTVLRGRV